jgi:hypothetical protein
VPLDSAASAQTQCHIVGASLPTMFALADYGRNACIIHNESGILFVGLGTSVTSSSYTYRLVGNTTLEIPRYIGSLCGIRASGQGTVQVTSLY